MTNTMHTPKTTEMSPRPALADNRTSPGTNIDFSRRNESISELHQILAQVIKMTELTLDAEATSVLLFRNNDQELYFEAASGPVGRTLRQVKLNTQYGIAGQVARTGKPLIVNDVARSKNFHKMIDDTTGFATQSLICAPLNVNRKIFGVIEVLNKRDGTPFGEHDLEAVVSVANTAAMAIENTRLYQNLLETYKATIQSVAEAVDSKVSFIPGHSQRVMEYSLKAGAVLSFTPEEMETLGYAGLLHDVGKIMIDSTILRKAAPLTPEELEIMQEHPVNGAKLMSGIPFLEEAGVLVLNHHEKYDGKGYPDGTKGEDIPMGARIIAVADAFDLMTNDRAFCPAVSIEEAVKELHKNSGTRFCPVAVKALISGLRLNMVKQ